jgi:electron-transferring-flavoprotein dehydrogenase
VTEDRFLFLSESKAYKTPNWLLPTCFQNHGNYVISLGNVTRWLGQQAEALGVEIFPASRPPKCCTTRTARSRAWPPATWASTRKASRPGLPAGHGAARQVHLFAEGARGHLGKQLIAKYKLDAGRDPQTYGIGIKELWEIEARSTSPAWWSTPPAGRWTTTPTAAPSCITWRTTRSRSAYVVGLDYQNPICPVRGIPALQDPPEIRKFFEGGKRISYGARAITAGGLQSLPKLVFPGGALVGCDAGFLNASRIKGSHAAIKTGMLAAEAAFARWASRQPTSWQPTRPPSSQLAARRAAQGAQLQALVEQGPVTGTLMTGIEQCSSVARRRGPARNPSRPRMPAPAAECARSPIPSRTAS